MNENDDYAFASDETFGLTKREYFAAAALQGLLAGMRENHDGYKLSDLARSAVRHGDAVLKEMAHE